MINRIKFLVILVFTVLGLSGCVLVDEDVSPYSPHPYGSYEAAVDYYHRPPRTYTSHHKHPIKIEKKEHHFDEHHDIKKPEPPKKEKIHDPKKGKYHEPKQEPEHHVKKKIDNPKKLEHHDFKKGIGKPEQSRKPLDEKMHNPKASEHHEPKKDMIKKPEQPKQPLEGKIHNQKMPEHHDMKKEIKHEQHNIKHK